LKIYHLLLIFCFNISTQVSGQDQAPIIQDTVNITIASAEQRFIDKNLTLLINKYNIDIAKDNMLQARLWYNPNLNYSTTLYNVETHKFFNDYYPTSRFSDENIQIQQLLTLGGRYKATWKLAEVGIKQAKYQLADILRNLKYELHTDISDLYYNQQLISIYSSEEEAIKHMLDVTKELYKNGNASGNAVLQLQTQLQDAVALEITSRQSVINDEQDLKILLQYPKNTHFSVKELPMPVTELRKLPAYQAVMDSAEKNRPDLLLSYTGSEYAIKNLKLQRATAMPDLIVGALYSGVNASAAAYTGIYGDMDIPVFNRNQWNIQAAKHQIKQAEASDTLSLSIVRNQVTSAYMTMILINKQLSQIDALYGQDYSNSLDEMMHNAVTNYESRNINLLTLLSLLSTYIDGKTNLLSLQVQYFNAVKNVNLNTGIELIK